MDKFMSDYPTNQERTADYLKKFDREKTIKFLIKEDNPLILDVGANVGSSLDEFKQWWPDSSIHCFEPQHECWNELEQMASKFHEKSVVINKCALGSIPNDQATFYSHEITSGQSGFNKINLQSQDSIHLNSLLNDNPQSLPEYEQSLNKERSVKIIRLDDYLERLNINRVNLLKIDTQGFENQVLEGLGGRLADIDVVITELIFYDYYEHSLSFSDIERFLIPAGFHLYDISHISKNPMNGRTDWVDVIYVNNRLRAGV
jgi:FkbM family methyltransferase